MIEGASLYKTLTTALRAWKCIPPLVAGATTLPGGKHVTGFSVAYGSLRIQFPCHPVGSMSLDSRVAYSSPMNPVPLPPPQFGGATKGKRLNGQARRLTSPHLEVLCRTSTGDNNPCLLQSRLRREASRCFILPPEQGEVRRSWIGGGERSEPISRMLIMPYDTVRQARNADFMFIARKGDTTTLGPKGRQTYEPSGRRPVNPKNLSH